ncbi:MAG: hypothetical protein JKY03_03525 [Aureispira sp.]|nr:hypothetical protein [Aureispira sp.]
MFAGSRSIGKVAQELDCEVFSIDIHPFEGIDFVKDIEFLKLSDVPFKPDIIWASPPCTSYSIAAITHHRDNGRPKTDFAAKSDRVILNMLKIIKESDCIFYIENPRGYLRKMPFMQGLARETVWYCKYGHKNAKPTDIWSNNIRSLWNLDGWQPRPICHNGNRACHHEAAPRSSKSGTQGQRNNYERSKIPPQLCHEIMSASLRKIA